MTGKSQLGEDPGGALQPYTKNYSQEKPSCEMLVDGGGTEAMRTLLGGLAKENRSRPFCFPGDQYNFI